MEGFDQAADMVRDNAAILKASLMQLRSSLETLSIPEEHWEEGKEVKTNLRQLAVQIDIFITDAKAGLDFALEAKQQKKVFEWIAGVEGSLVVIGNSLDTLLAAVDESKAKVSDLKVKLLADASGAEFWARISLSATLIAATAKVVAVTALGATVPVVFLPIFVTGAAATGTYASDAWKKYATAD